MKKRNLNIKIAILFLTAVAIGSCHTGQVRKRLAEIDSMLYNDQDRLAYLTLEAINPDSIADEDDRAYYDLLKMQVYYRMYKPLPDSIIDRCVSYYEQSSDKEKRAFAYTYRGAYYQDSLKVFHTINNYKKAENLSSFVRNKKLLIILYEHLCFMNFQGFNYEKAKGYALKYLHVAKSINDKYWMTCALSDLSNCYWRLGKRDSSIFYFQQCLPQMNIVEKKVQSYIYRTIGSVMEETDSEYATKNYLKAIELYHDPYAYYGLSRLYFLEGRIDKTREMWNEALKSTDMSIRIDVLQAMRKQEQREGHWQQAARLAEWQLGLKDSLRRQQESWKIAQLQNDYDQQLRTLELQRSQQRAWHLGVMAIMGMALLMLLLRYTTVRQRHKMMRAAQQIAIYQKRIAKLEQQLLQAAGGTGVEKQKEQWETEIRLLRKKIANLEEHNASLLARGKTLYEQLQQGDTMAKWGKAEFESFVAYYGLTDYSFVQHLELDYDGLSPKYTSFAILQHLGYDDAEIGRIMGISPNTVRSIRSRIKSQKMED